MFHYLGNERLQLWFFSPNVCATFLVMTALLTIGLFLVVRERKGVPFRLAAAGLFTATLSQFVCLALTYSRGGYLALFAGLLLAAVCSRKRWNIAFPLLFAAVLLLTADGGARVKSIADMGDGSIRNRLLLWQGGAGIIARHWAMGIGAPPAAGVYYTAWYQPTEIDEQYYTLISDGLTLAASYGLFALFGLLALVAFLLHQGIKTWTVGKNPFLLYSLAAFGGYLVCGVFSTCYRFPNLVWLPGCVALALLVFILHDRRRCRPGRTPNDLWPPLLFPALACLGLFTYGAWVNGRMPFRLKEGYIAVAGRRLRTLEATPDRKPEALAVVVSQNVADEGRSVIRPLAEAGYRVIALETGIGLDGVEVAKGALPALVTTGAVPVYLVAPGREESLVALAAASEMPEGAFVGVVLADTPADWPFDRLSPRRNLERLSSPVIAVQRGAYVSDGHALAAAGAVFGRVVRVLEMGAAEGAGIHGAAPGALASTARGRTMKKGEVMVDAMRMGFAEK